MNEWNLRTSKLNCLNSNAATTNKTSSLVKEKKIKKNDN